MKHKRAKFFAAIASLALSQVARAGDITWTNPAGGTFSVASNWSPLIVPGATDRAFFTLPSAYPVVVTSSVTNQELRLNAGTVLLTAPGSAYVVSGGAFLDAALNVSAGTFSPTDLVIGSG